MSCIANPVGEEVTLGQDNSRDVVVSCGSAEQGSKKLIRVDTGHVHRIMAASIVSVYMCMCMCTGSDCDYGGGVCILD